MERIQSILHNELWQSCIRQNKTMEKEREFCGHDISHLLDVARIAYLYVLTNHIPIPQDILYAAALLHDIGKWKQYLDGTPHNEASVELAEKILKDSLFTPEETNLMLSAILRHRTEQKLDGSLSSILFYADKKSRMCFLCPAEQNCNWADSKKNKELIF